jgi:hypothetical protein
LGVPYLKFRRLTLVCGKAKTAASAAFLGVLPVCLQKDVRLLRECHKLSRQKCLSPQGQTAGPGVVHTSPGRQV